MKQYNLGPNGGILTSLNLFTTKFDQVLALMEKRAESVDHMIIDTPGQIEIFTWSASGAIITDAIASTFPTVVAYIVDTPRAAAPATFMSNMLYACSILYKTKLPFVLVFNKVDVQSPAEMMEWMADFEAFQRALASEGGRQRDADGEPTYMNSLMNSMSLVLDEFYKELKTVAVSSYTGAGIPEFFEAVEGARQEYESVYIPELARVAKLREQNLAAKKTESLSRFMQDLNVDPNRDRLEKWDPAAMRDDEEYEFEDDDGEYIDRSPGPHVDMDRASRPGTGGKDVRWPRPG